MSSSSKGFCRSVSGPLNPAELGHVQCHEHIWLRRGPSADCNPALCMDDFDKSLAELREYRSAGGSAIVDAQPAGFGRDAGMLQKLDTTGGVHILAVTGFHKLQFMEADAPLRRMSQADMTSFFLSELEQGLICPGGRRLDAQAALVKLAYERGGWTDSDYAPLFSAAARAAAESGAPVMVHTEKGNDILGLIKWLNNCGVPAQKLLICHLDRTHHDAQYHRRVLDTGCTLCYDSVHREKYVSAEQELALIKEMCADGYADRIVLSLDTTNRRLRAYNASDMGLDYILTTFIPRLHECGIKNAHIEAMCRKNAAHFLQY